MSRKKNIGVIPLAPEEIGKVRKTFKLFDRDNSDMITKQDIPKVWRSMGQNPTDEELKEIAEMVDSRHAGMVSWEEFYPLLARNAIKDASLMQDELREAFRYFDRDDNGYVSPKDLAEAMKKSDNPLTDEEVADMLSMVETNSKGLIDYEAFVKAFTSRPDKSENEEVEESY